MQYLSKFDTCTPATLPLRFDAIVTSHDFTFLIVYYSFRKDGMKKTGQGMSP